MLHEVREFSAVVFDGQDQRVLARHKCKLSNGSNHFLEFNSGLWKEHGGKGEGEEVR